MPIQFARGETNIVEYFDKYWYALVIEGVIWIAIILVVAIIYKHDSTEKRVNLIEPEERGKFTTGLCGCCQESKSEHAGCSLCIFTWCFPSLRMGRNIVILASINFWVIVPCLIILQAFVSLSIGGTALVLFGLGLYYRLKLKKKFQMKGGCCGDCLTWFFCAPCAICQEAIFLEENSERVLDESEAGRLL